MLAGARKSLPSQKWTREKIFLMFLLPVLDRLLVGCVSEEVICDISLSTHTQGKIAVRLFDEEMAASVKKVPATPAISKEMGKLQVGKGVLRVGVKLWWVCLFDFLQK